MFILGRGYMPKPELPRQPSQTPPSPEATPRAPDELTLLVVPLRKFSMGQMVITSNAQAVLTPEDVSMAFVRHSRGDWGDVCAEDRQMNERGVLDQGMILSAYHSAKGGKFWVITDPGHEVTTVLLPEDY
jgi:hypothetical protein